MALSRKHKKEIKRLKSTASDLWDEQRDVFGHASSVVKEAGRQIGNVSREEVVPRVSGAYNDRLVPVVSSGYKATRNAVDGAQHKIVHDVIPGVSSSLASALATLEVSKDPRVREAVKQVHLASDKVGKSAKGAYADVSKKAVKTYNTVGTRVGFVKPPKRGLGFGGYALIALGVVAVAGIAYAAWQTLRADDELWVLDEAEDGDTPQQ
ncbi:DNA helicase [Marisediminicola senii]|uniref:DNA helicase n=1 Tax=Marisediminicola senii TaxID=2711233 RepID=UPI0013EABF91|nr:DNA helicase [Marisediminicola senii]